MDFRPRPPVVQSQFCQAVTVETITRVVPVATLNQVIEANGVREQRVRKLPAHLTVWVLIGMKLYTTLSIQAVIEKLARGGRLLWPNWECVVAGASAFSQRRYQLGVRVLAALFRAVCRPLATEHTRGAYLFGLRLVAVDGTKDDVPDTPANAQVFGRHAGPKGESGYPKVLSVLLSECGTHAIFDAAFGPCYASERALAHRLLRSLGAGMLVLFDRGFYSFDWVDAVRAHGAQALGRLAAHVRPIWLQALPDGTYLAKIQPSDYRRQRQGDLQVIRLITYTVTDPKRPGYRQQHRLFTTLLDPVRYPALTLIAAYHERWEIELVVDELQTHQRLAAHPLRSLKPRGVIQELYALLIAHYIVRVSMHDAALVADLDPDRLSFIAALRLIQDALIEFQLADPACHPALLARLLRDLLRHQLPERRNRLNPRVVKRTILHFPRKRPEHAHLPQPSGSFQDAVALI